MNRRTWLTLLAASFAAACTSVFRSRPTLHIRPALRVHGFRILLGGRKGTIDRPWLVQWTLRQEFGPEASYYHEANHINLKKMCKAVGQTVRDPRELLRHVS